MTIVAADAALVHHLRRSALAELVYTQGACNDEYTEMWYPAAPTSREATLAIAACFGCAVRGECLELALRIDAGQHGIWGGMSEEGRRELRRKQATRLARARRLDADHGRRR
jgi:WhiB family redox-sensing transcriptional regulator